MSLKFRKVIFLEGGCGQYCCRNVKKIRSECSLAVAIGVRRAVELNEHRLEPRLQCIQFQMNMRNWEHCYRFSCEGKERCVPLKGRYYRLIGKTGKSRSVNK